jgi:3-oxoacyl-(acyl-carrier-protein) synthase
VGAALEALIGQGAQKGESGDQHQLAAMRSRLCLLGNKSTVGHSEPAAGITALAYAVVQVMRYTWWSPRAHNELSVLMTL